MTQLTVATCSACGHQEKPNTRRVVVCDTCGEQDDLVYSPILCGKTPPRPKWRGSFFEDGERVGRADFCSLHCQIQFFKWHEQAAVYA